MPVVRRQQVNEAGGLRCLILEYYGCHTMGSINHWGNVMWAKLQFCGCFNIIKRSPVVPCSCFSKLTGY